MAARSHLCLRKIYRGQQIVYTWPNHQIRLINNYGCIAKCSHHKFTGNYDVTSFVASVKACIKYRDLQTGSRLHGEMLSSTYLRKNKKCLTSLIDMYAKCGALPKAKEVFEELPVRDVIAWTALIAGYAQHGYGNEALQYFEEMRSEGLSPNAVTFVVALKACASLKATEKGIKIHDEISKGGLLEKDVILGNALLDMYARCGVLSKAEDVFHELPLRNVVSWTSLIAGYTEHGHGERALEIFEQMQLAGIAPNSFTYVCSLRACGTVRSLDVGKAIHANIVREGLVQKNIMIGNALLDMYGKCGAFTKAQEVFEELPHRDVVSWTALISGFAEHGYGEAALDCFDEMQSQGICPNIVSYICALKACGSVGAIDKGNEMYTEIARQGLVGEDTLIGGALVDMYAKCGALTRAEEVFKHLPVHNVVSWTALMTGHAQHGNGEHALNWFEEMQDKGLSPNAMTFSCALKACGNTGSFDRGKEIHENIMREGLLQKDIFVGNALVDMYSKCGVLPKAQNVFDDLPCRDVVSWNAQITGFVQLGNDEIVCDAFQKMLDEGIKPNLVTFIVVLNACSHLGLVDKAQMCFEVMTKEYGIVPTLEHYTCMVDLFGRLGHFEKAVAMIQKMPTYDYPPVWAALLGACQKWVNVELGRWAFEHAILLDENNVAAYVSMSNIYVAAAMKEDAERIEAMRISVQNCSGGCG